MLDLPGKSDQYLLGRLADWIMMIYRGFEYFKDDDSLWKVIVEDSIIIVALDDSKTSGNRRIIEEKNSEQSCKDFIDWSLS